MDKIIKSLLILSEEELNSAKNIYNKGIYHKSLFLFQQSVEKAYKAFALSTRQIEIDDLRNVGHATLFRICNPIPFIISICNAKKAIHI